jgi:predicted transcriptional regulator
MSDTSATTVKLDAELRERLAALGTARRRSSHFLMVEAIRSYLEREEYQERERAIARDRLARYDATGEYLRGDDVRAWAESLGTSRELPPPKLRRRGRSRR